MTSIRDRLTVLRARSPGFALALCLLIAGFLVNTALIWRSHEDVFDRFLKNETLRGAEHMADKSVRMAYAGFDALLRTILGDTPGGLTDALVYFDSSLGFMDQVFYDKFPCADKTISLFEAEVDKLRALDGPPDLRAIDPLRQHIADLAVCARLITSANRQYHYTSLVKHQEGVRRFTEAFLACDVALFILILFVVWRWHVTLDRQHRLGRLAVSDPLTGLLNRRSFAEELPRYVSKAKSRSRRLVFCLIDFDHFKIFNDLYGHEAGDRALKTVGDIVRKRTKRIDDLAFRIGGDEYALLTLADNVSEATALGQSLIKDMARLGLRHTGNVPAGHVTLSVGISCLGPEELELRGGPYHLADKALYRAKNEGRNRAIVLTGNESEDRLGEVSRPHIGFEEAAAR